MSSTAEIAVLIKANKELASKLKLVSKGLLSENEESEKILDLLIDYKELSEELADAHYRLVPEPKESANPGGKNPDFQLELTKAYKDIASQYEEKAKLAEALIVLNNELQDKELFIKTLAHDLRSPFCGLLGLSHLLSESICKKDISEIELFGNLINQSLHETFLLLEDILTWIKIHSDKVTFNPQKIDLKDICQETSETFKSFAASKQITINCLNIETKAVFADLSMLKGIFRNLFSNAIKFTKEHGHIDISAANDDEFVTITISDSGIGIHSENLFKLFDKPQQFSTRGTSGEMGTGLGLVLCKQFVEKNKGRIWVESDFGKGTRFSFSLPKFCEEQINK